MKKVLYFSILLIQGTVAAQFNDFAQFYPIGDDPNIRYMTSYTSQETILFEANPIVRYSFYNNFLKELMREKNVHSQAWYINFKPQLRMYDDNSKPVRMPSYKILLGTQHLFRIEDAGLKQVFAGFSLESGHYSNGQDGAAFSEEYADDSPESEKIYNAITDDTDISEILNRRSGNFSTNLTELILNYRCYDLSEEDLTPLQMHSFNLGYVLYHNYFVGLADFGGYTQNDIKLYGRHRFLGSYEYMQVLTKHKNKRYSVKQTLEIIQKAHRSVNPFRAETIVTYYPFPKSKTFGFVASYIYGHDNYNFRFVDSGQQFTFGLTWTQFPPIQMKGGL